MRFMTFLCAATLSFAALFLPFIVQADCAWVLWKEVHHGRFNPETHRSQEEGSFSSWNRQTATTTERECRVLLTAVIEGHHAALARSKASGDYTEIHPTITGGWADVSKGDIESMTSTDFACWPDTVDPRK